MALKKTGAVGLLIMGLSLAAHGQPAAQTFHPRIMSWLYSDSRTVMVENPQGQWFWIGLAADCNGLKAAVDVTIRVSPQGRRQLLTGAARCEIASIAQVSDASLYTPH